ncbi:MAG: AAA family ATPase [Candidatus Micrarchaeota archaeon]
MKGPNPFAWNPESSEVFGRKTEITIFKSFANATASKQSGVLVIFGGTGIGKTTLLRNFKQIAEKFGLDCIYIKAEKSETECDLVGKTFANEKNFENAIRKIKTGTIIMIDGIEKLAGSEKLADKLTRLVNSYWNKKPISIVLSSTREITREGNRIIELRRFDEHDIREMIDNAMKKGLPKMGDECIHSILNDSGGNPKLARMICWYIYEKLKENEKLITKGHYLSYLPYIMTMLSNEWFGRLYQETPKAEREVLRKLAEEEMLVSEIAKELKKPMGPVATLTKRLLDRGQIIRIERGRYRIFAKLYGKYILQRN